MSSTKCKEVFHTAWILLVYTSNWSNNFHSLSRRCSPVQKRTHVRAHLLLSSPSKSFSRRVLDSIIKSASLNKRAVEELSSFEKTALEVESLVGATEKEQRCLLHCFVESRFNRIADMLYVIVLPNSWRGHSYRLYREILRAIFGTTELPGNLGALEEPLSAARNRVYSVSPKWIRHSWRREEFDQQN